MKTYEEMAKSVLQRRGEYVETQQARRKKCFRAASGVVVLGVLVVAIVGILHAGWRADNRKFPSIDADRLNVQPTGEIVDNVNRNYGTDRKKFRFPGDLHGVLSDSDKLLLSEEDVVFYATHILDATYLGTYTTKYGTEFMFLPTKVYKGELSDKNQFAIYVTLRGDCEVSPHSPDDAEGIPFKENKTYLLFLEKHISVYYEHDKFVPLSEMVLASNDAKRDGYYEQVEAMIKNDSSSVAMHGLSFTESDNLDEVLEASDNIFVVKIESVIAESTFTPTTVYSCRVQQLVRDASDVPQDIWVPLFNDTVKVGGEYLLLLSAANDTKPVYSLSSRLHSVYAVSDAEAIPELRELLTTARAYGQPPDKTDDRMIWKKVKDKGEFRLSGDFREVSKEVWQGTFHVDLPDAEQTAYYLVYKIVKDEQNGAQYTDDLMCGYVELTNKDGSSWSMYLDESSLSTESAYFLCESPGSWQESIIDGNRVMLAVSDEHRYAALKIGEYSGYIRMRDMDEGQALSVLKTVLQKGNHAASSADAERTGMAKPLQCAAPEGSRIFVSSYKVDGHFQDKYKGPSQGEAFFSFPLGFAMQDYGDSAIYTVVASLFIGERPDEPPIDKAAIRVAELQRLNRLGYNVSLYKESADDAIEPGFLFQSTYDQLVNFPTSDDYGYFIYLKDEGPNYYK